MNEQSHAVANDLLSRIEDAGLNASAPPQQLWQDGWLLRFSPGKAKRARCINAVAVGRLGLAQKLAFCEPIYRDANLPLVVRLTPFSQPAGLDGDLAAMGFARFDDTRVMVRASLADFAPAPLPESLCIERVGHAAFAQQVGRLRGSPLAQCLAHAQRLEQSPVKFEGFVLKAEDGSVLACGQSAAEAELVGLYDVFTNAAQRGRGFAGRLCAHLLLRARERGAKVAYLQVDADNHAARQVYRRLGFADAYAYHYRARESASA